MFPGVDFFLDSTSLSMSGYIYHHWWQSAAFQRL